jgi:sialate O-acetylesterase
MKSNIWNIIIILISILFGPSLASIRLSFSLSDNAILQRNAISPPATLWGFANPNITVSITMDNMVLSPSVVTSDDSLWKFSLPPFPAGGPHIFLFNASDGSSVSMSNVFFGDVYIVSGQSNAQFTVFSAFNATEEIAATSLFPFIRVFTVGQSTASNVTLVDFETIEQSWSVASPESIGSGDWTTFSALGWFFARDLFSALNSNIPIGIISSNFGGTALISWCSTFALSQCGTPPAPPLQTDLTNNQNIFGASPYDASTLWNAMIAPLTTGPTSLKGILFFQGEADAGPYGSHSDWYSCEIQAMVQDWRRQLLNPTLGFLTVVLAPFNGPSDKTWPDVREAQLAVLNLPYTGYGSAIDIGDNLAEFGSYHPPKKQVPARRLVDAALDVLYGIPKQWRGPEYLGMNLIRFSNGTISIEILFHPETIGQGGLVLSYNGNNSHCPIADGVNPLLCEDFVILATSSGHEPIPTYTYLGNGFIDAGNDISNGNYTLFEAKDVCDGDILCTGFTFNSNSSECNDRPGGYCNMYFKSAISFTNASDWQAYSNGRRSGGLVALNLTAAVSVDAQSIFLTTIEPIIDSQEIVALSYAYSTWPVTPLYGLTSDSTLLPARPFYINITNKKLV